MTVIQKVAKELQMKPKKLLEASLELYLEQRLSKVESDIFLIAKKHGVKDVFEMDKKIKEGFIHENEGHDDFFILDNLEAERDKIKTILDNL